MILAAIDIGSNAVRLLINDVTIYENGKADFTKLTLLRIPLRLGFDVFKNGHIDKKRRQKLVDTIKIYKLLMDVYEVEEYRACATSAMRDATNGAEIIDAIKKETDIDIKVITGLEEADIIYETHIAENLEVGSSYLYIDVGGGSTEVTLFSDNKTIFKESFNVGTIRLLNDAVTQDQWDYIKQFIKKETKNYRPLKAIGSGGNINKTFSISKTKEGKSLSIQLLKDYYKELGLYTLEERKHIYNLRADRADVIVPALNIYISIMRWAGADRIFVPKIGLADGLIKMMYQEYLEREQV